MLLSFIVLKLMGISMNMVVLFSLILALGMLVDNAIVVVENIYRYLEEGWDRTLAAKKATGEVAIPVIASTATTLAAFAPLMFWPGETGEFMKFLPLTLIVTLTSSLFVALVIVPVLCAMFMKLDGTPSTPLRPAARWTLIGAAGLILLIVAGMNPLTAALLALTAVGLWALQRYVLASAAAPLPGTGAAAGDRGLRKAAALGAGPSRSPCWPVPPACSWRTVILFAFFNHGIEFFPEKMPPQQLLVNVEAPLGTRADFTDTIVQRIEKDLKTRDRRLTGLGVRGGRRGRRRGRQLHGPGPRAVPRAAGSPSAWSTSRTASATRSRPWRRCRRRSGKDIAGATISVDKPNEGAPQGAPVNIEIVGEDPDQLKALSDEVLGILQNAPVYRKLVGLESDLDEARSELSVHVDREKAALYDLSTAKVGGAIRSAINGVEAAKYRTGNDEYDIVVRLAEPYRQELEGLRDLTVMAEGGVQVPLSSVATWSVEEGYGSIRRKDQTRMATITLRRGGRVQLQRRARRGADRRCTNSRRRLPPGYTVRYTGQSEDQAEAQAFLGGAFLTALLLICFILISQFNSLVKPLIIMTSVIMSTVGVLMGLMIFQMPFGIIMSGVGLISLAGIVVNNAIILIDYIDILRDRDGMSRREALVQGGKTRFRPVILTATTTALGLVPLAVGLNFDFLGLYSRLDADIFWGGEQAAWWGPMAVAVIVGILFATFLTLVLVPVLYSLVDDVAKFFDRHFRHRGAEDGVSTEDMEDEEAYAPSHGGARDPAGVRRSGEVPGDLSLEPGTG